MTATLVVAALLATTPKLEFNPQRINDPALADPVGPSSSGDAVLRAQVLLDRARFSPGEIDGYYGVNLRSAVMGFQQANGLPLSGTIGPEMWAVLNQDKAPVVVEYKITTQDVAGPFEREPKDLMAQSKLKSLSYQSPIEALGEKFHASPSLLKRLNPRASFLTEGEDILVPSVAQAAPPVKAASVVVSASLHTVTALDDQGKPLAQFAATIGSTHDPLPLGQWIIKGVARNPVFHYNPDLFWDANPSHSKATIPAGPNNPVGVVWIDLSIPHYGIHGTPEPSEVGHAQSHGCIRLTNWDALKLAAMVKPGTPALLEK